MDRPTISYCVDDEGNLCIYKGKVQLAKVSDCGGKSDMEIFYLVKAIVDDIDIAECEVNE